MENKNYKWISVLTWSIIIGIWFFATEVMGVSSAKLPSPFDVVRAFVDIVKNGYNYIPLWRHLGISFARLLVAVILSILTAIPVGLMSGYFPRFRAVVNSVVNFYRPLPPLAYYTLLIIWLGIGEESKVMLLYLASFAPMYIASVSAVSSVNREFILSAMTLGVKGHQIFAKVVLPASLPNIFVGIRTAVGVAYTTLVSSEMIAATAGIGWMVMDAYKYIKTDVVFVGIIIMGISGILIDVLLSYIEEKYIFWKGKY